MIYLLGFTQQANNKIPDNCKYLLTLIQADSNQKETNTGDLAKGPGLKIGAKVMITANIDIEDSLINGQTENNI